MPYRDLHIIDNDLAFIDDDSDSQNTGLEATVDNKASIAQDIQHMIRESGLLVQMIGQRNSEAVKLGMRRIELLAQDDVRLIAGTVEVERTNTNTFYLSADTREFGALKLGLTGANV